MVHAPDTAKPNLFRRARSLNPSALGQLRSRHLHIGDYVGIPALFVAGIDSGCGIAVRRAVDHGGIRVQGACIQQGVDLGERFARTRIRRAINVIARDIRGRACTPRQVDRVYGRSRRTGSSEGFDRCRGLGIAPEGKRGCHGAGGLRAELHRKRSAVPCWNRNRQRQSSDSECGVVAADRADGNTRSARGESPGCGSARAHDHATQSQGGRAVAERASGRSRSNPREWKRYGRIRSRRADRDGPSPSPGRRWRELCAHQTT